jgi:hypothetical protein
MSTIDPRDEMIARLTVAVAGLRDEIEELVSYEGAPSSAVNAAGIEELLETVRADRNLRDLPAVDLDNAWKQIVEPGHRRWSL